MQTPINSQNVSQSIINKPTLRRGSQGNDVREVQRLLTHWGYGNTGTFVDGVFNEIMESRVKAYQRRVFLKEDGIVGSVTWQALYTGAPVNMPELRWGSKGQTVMVLQEVLQITRDYIGKIDGDFGSRTEQSVKTFQKRANLVDDGIVGSRTWHALSKVSR